MVNTATGMSRTIIKTMVKLGVTGYVRHKMFVVSTKVSSSGTPTYPVRRMDIIESTMHVKFGFYFKGPIWNSQRWSYSYVIRRTPKRTKLSLTDTQECRIVCERTNACMYFIFSSTSSECWLFYEKLSQYDAVPSENNNLGFASRGGKWERIKHWKLANQPEACVRKRWYTLEQVWRYSLGVQLQYPSDNVQLRDWNRRSVDSLTLLSPMQ